MSLSFGSSDLGSPTSMDGACLLEQIDRVAIDTPQQRALRNPRTISTKLFGSAPTRASRASIHVELFQGLQDRQMLRFSFRIAHRCWSPQIDQAKRVSLGQICDGSCLRRQHRSLLTIQQTHTQLLLAMRCFKAVGLFVGTTVVVVLWSSTPSRALPNGAAECTAGDLLSNDPNAAAHRSRTTVMTGSLEDFGFRVLLDETMLVRNKQRDIVAMVPHEITIRAPKDGFFRGFLVRIEDPRGNVDTFDYLASNEDDEHVQVSEICTDNEETGGITHSNNDKKTSITGTLTTEFVDFADVVLLLDVTVVVQNRQDTSEWYYSRFTLRSVDFQSPTKAPVEITPSPTIEPTKGTMKRPTQSPTLESTPVPTNRPTRIKKTPSPTVKPTPATKGTTQLPTTDSTPAPTNQPTAKHTPPVSASPTTSPTVASTAMGSTQIPTNPPTAVSTTTGPTQQALSNPTLIPTVAPSKVEASGTSADSCINAYSAANTCFGQHGCRSNCLTKDNLIDFGGLCETTKRHAHGGCSCLDPVCPAISQCCPSCEQEIVNAVQCDLKLQSSPCVITCDPFNKFEGQNSGTREKDLDFPLVAVLLTVGSFIMNLFA